MYCQLKYCHPITSNQYYFVKFCSDENGLRPVGCFSYRRKDRAMTFKTKREAQDVAKQLNSLGYKAFVV